MSYYYPSNQSLERSENSLSEVLSQLFCHIRVKIDEEERRLKKISRGFRKRTFHGTTCKRAKLEQLDQLNEAINRFSDTGPFSELKDKLLLFTQEETNNMETEYDDVPDIESIKESARENLRDFQSELNETQGRIQSAVQEAFVDGYIGQQVENLFSQIVHDLQAQFDHEPPYNSECRFLETREQISYEQCPPDFYKRPEEPEEDIGDWEPPDYKVIPIHRFERQECLKGVAVDKENDIFLVANQSNAEVQIFGLEDKQKKGEIIDDEMKKPYGIAISDKFVYVTDTKQHSVFCFEKDTHKKLKVAGGQGTSGRKLNAPCGICVDSLNENTIYVADSLNNCICVYNKDLEYKKIFGMKVLKKPHDVSCTQGTIVVLDWGTNCVHFFLKSGQYIRSCVRQARNRCVCNPHFFAIDPAKNIIISDCMNSRFKIFDKNGKHVHTFPVGGEGNGYPGGVALTEGGTSDRFIIVATEIKKR